jgi:peptide deformylase
MSILKIAQMGHPVLRQIAKSVDDPTAADIQKLIHDMIETMADANGAGLAAPQVHQSLRIVVFQAPPDRVDAGIAGDEAFDHQASLTVLINPVIEVLSRDIAYGWEGCLSVTGLRGWVPRADYIRYSGLGTDGAPIVRIARGFHARVVQHECDHLDGVLYPQRMDDLSMLVFAQEMRHGLPKPVATPPLIFPE